jgi:cytidylate kinase
MSIIMLSSLSHSGREDLAESLARKTGWPVLNREYLLDQARRVGIKVGRLEVAMIKSGVMSEKLAREKDLYQALVTAVLCEKAREGNLIYHGRSGHLLLPGVSHRFRVGLTAPRETRVRTAAAALKISPDRAESYLDKLDEDIHKWVHFMHKTDGLAPNNFDLFINLENMGLANASTIICEMAESEEFRPMPAGVRRMDDLYLAAQAKLRLSMDKRTMGADLSIRCSDAVLTVTYPPRQDSVSDDIACVLEDLEGCREVQCTMAETSILWVQEQFDPDSPNFEQIIEVAQRWGAAVELLRLIPPGELGEEHGVQSVVKLDRDDRTYRVPQYTGGVEDDEPAEEADDGGLECTQEQLVLLGRSAGHQTVCGGQAKIMEALKSNGRYTLVVIGDMFLSKGRQTRTRQTRELAMAIRDRLKAPVITADELKSRFLFGPKQAVKLAVLSALTVLIYILVLTNQAPILDFMGGELHQNWKWLTSIAVFIFVPAVAYIYGSVAGLVLKLVNVD